MSEQYSPQPETRRPPRRRKRRRPRRDNTALGVLGLVVVMVGITGFFVWGLPSMFSGMTKPAEIIEQLPEAMVPKAVLYPMTFENDIRYHAAEFGLEPERVAAVMLCESSFDPNAVSSVDARGLMQIMPTTGEWLATKFPDVPYDGPDTLFDPTTNMRFGCWYLSYLDGLFDGDLVKATAAYHTGQGTVANWLEDPAYSPDGVELRVIPSDVTGTYVNRVVAAYEAYKELYHEPITPIETEEA